VLDNEKTSEVDKILRESFCKILFNVLNDNLISIVNEPVIKKSVLHASSNKNTIISDNKSYERLAGLFQNTLDDLFPTNEETKQVFCIYFQNFG
jgi:hypothetical protein